MYLLNKITDASPPATVPTVVLTIALSTQPSHLYVSLNSLGILASEDSLIFFVSVPDMTNWILWLPNEGW